MVFEHTIIVSPTVASVTYYLDPKLTERNVTRSNNSPSCPLILLFLADVQYPVLMPAAWKRDPK